MKVICPDCGLPMVKGGSHYKNCAVDFEFCSVCDKFQKLKVTPNTKLPEIETHIRKEMKKFFSYLAKHSVSAGEVVK